MMMSAVTIRPARKEDSEFLAWVVLRAARSHLRVGFFEAHLHRLDKEERLQVLREVIENEGSPHKSFMHWDGFLIAEVDGQPVAGKLPSTSNAFSLCTFLLLSYFFVLFTHWLLVDRFQGLSGYESKYKTGEAFNELLQQAFIKRAWTKEQLDDANEMWEFCLSYIHTTHTPSTHTHTHGIHHTTTTTTTTHTPHTYTYSTYIHTYTRHPCRHSMSFLTIHSCSLLFCVNVCSENR